MTFEVATIPETGVSADAEAPHSETPNPAPHAVQWPSRWALALGILTPFVVALGMAAATLDAYLVATVVAWVAIVTSAVAILAGVFGIVRGSDRTAAIVGMVLGVLGNPLVLLYGVNAIRGIG